MQTRNQRGAGAIGCLLMLGIVAAAVYAGFMFAMPKFRHGSFEDRLTETLLYYAKQPPDVVRDRVIATAADFDIALTPENVKVDVSGQRLTLDVRYEKVVDLKVWKKTLVFTSHRSGTY